MIGQIADGLLGTVKLTEFYNRITTFLPCYKLSNYFTICVYKKFIAGFKNVVKFGYHCLVLLFTFAAATVRFL